MKSTQPLDATYANPFLADFGPWALVTGASEGIGLETCRQLAQRGLNLVMVARRGERLDVLANELELRYGIQCQPIAMDLSVRGATAALDLQTNELDIGLVAVAAGFGSIGRLVDQSLDTELDMVQVNISATLEASHRFGRRLASRGGGGIVLFSSVVAFQGVPGSANYAATKAYVQSLAEALHDELAPSGVRVLACAPGPVGTGFAARAGMRMGKALTPSQVVLPTLQALESQRRTVRPGWLSKVLGWSLAMLPRSARIKVLGKVMQGMMPAAARAAGPA
jgi:short-subunit dehydrogenase